MHKTIIFFLIFTTFSQPFPSSKSTQLPDPTNSRIEFIDISHDNRILALASRNKNTYIYHLENGSFSWNQTISSTS